MLIKRIGVYGLVFVVMLSIVSCRDNKKAEETATHHTQVIIAEVKPQNKYLYFSGKLAPIQSTYVTSEVDGRVTAMYANYGAVVSRGQKLAAIKASGLEGRFRDAVTDFLQKKSVFEQEKTRFEGDGALYKAGVISKENYESSKKLYQTSALDFDQSRFQLKKILRKLGVSAQSIEDLSLGKAEQVSAILNQSFPNIILRAPVAGILLLPEASKSSLADRGENQALVTVGSDVKDSQTVFEVGDPSRYKVIIPVSEIDVAEFKKGLKAEVTGDAFPGIVLHGAVSYVAAQASSQGSGGFSVYTSQVDLHNLSKAERRMIRVGMTVKVKVLIKKLPRLMVPIKAIFLKKGQAYLTQVDKTGRRSEVAVETGTTTETEVVIERGLEPGSKVVVPVGF